MALVGCEEFSELFESVAGFQRVFPRDWSTIADRHVPRRGLREINRFGHFPLLQKISPAKKIDDSTIDHVFAAESSVHGAMSPIARLQKNRERLHEKWVKDKNLGAGDLRDYCETLAGISQHRRDSGFVNLVDHVRAHRTIMSVLGRLVDYVGLFERDLYFVTLALMHRAGLRPDKLFDEEGQRYLFNGQIIFALRELAKASRPAGKTILGELAQYFRAVWEKGNPDTAIRNNIAHLNMLQGSNPDPRLTHWVNQTRLLMSYDRKLKNAVSKSVIELLAREGIDLRWEMLVDGTAHSLTGAELSSRTATHLGKTQLVLAKSGDRVALTETLHSDAYIEMVAASFDGRTAVPLSIAANLHQIDWEASAKSPSHKSSNQERPTRPRSGRDRHPNQSG